MTFYTPRSAWQMERDFIKAGRNEALVRQSGCCKYCFEPLTATTATAEHRVARSNRGSNLKHNIDAACQPCNRLKGSMTAGQFLKAIKNPGVRWEFLLAQSRRRIWLRMHRACRNIGRAVGMEVKLPIGPIASERRA